MVGKTLIESNYYLKYNCGELIQNNDNNNNILNEVSKIRGGKLPSCWDHSQGIKNFLCSKPGVRMSTV